MALAGGQVGLPSSVTAVEVGRMGISFIVRQGHPLAGRELVTRGDLAQFPLACGTGMMPQSILSMQIALQCDNYHILREVVLASNAVWLSSPLMCAPDFEAGKLVGLKLPDVPQMWSDVTLFSRKGRAKSPLAAQVIGMVTDYFSRPRP